MAVLAVTTSGGGRGLPFRKTPWEWTAFRKTEYLDSFVE